ncbi:MAG: lytic transglycosylase domain-containing protein [Candidatus Nitrospinota bacterium M3_3B_026]
MRIFTACAVAAAVAVTHISTCLLAYNRSAARAELAAPLSDYGDVHKRNEKQKILESVRRIINARARGLSPHERAILADAVVRYSAKNGHDPFLILAVIETESSFRQRAVSRKGAVGIMQIRPFVARALARELNISIKDAAWLYDFDTNLMLGSYYLAKMRKRFGSLRLALEAYNLGPTRLNRFIRKGVLRQSYSRKVLGKRERILEMLDRGI